MIYIRQDISMIPEEVLAVAQRAQDKLEGLPVSERRNFIKSRSHIWRAFNKYLREMSYGKCWYTEAKESHSFYHVDHFRPKLEAKRTEEIVDQDGYQWLAFDWENYRLSSQMSNTETTNPETGALVGKGSWFPLCDGSRTACWDDRCIEDESPMLLDPTVPEDAEILDFGDDGMAQSMPYRVGTTTLRVRESIQRYALNLPGIREARATVIRRAVDILDNIMFTAEALNAATSRVDEGVVENQIKQLKEMTRADAQFSKAVRAKLMRTAYGSNFIDRSKDAT